MEEGDGSFPALRRGGEHDHLKSCLKPFVITGLDRGVSTEEPAPSLLFMSCAFSHSFIHMWIVLIKYIYLWIKNNLTWLKKIFFYSLIGRALLDLTPASLSHLFSDLSLSWVCQDLLASERHSAILLLGFVQTLSPACALFSPCIQISPIVWGQPGPLFLPTKTPLITSGHDGLLHICTPIAFILSTHTWPSVKNCLWHVPYRYWTILFRGSTSSIVLASRPPAHGHLGQEGTSGQQCPGQN